MPRLFATPREIVAHFEKFRRLEAGAKRRAAATLASVWRARAELLLAIGILGGWCALTWVIADIIGHATRVWLVSFALLSFSLVGWRYLWVLAITGLYVLTRPAKEKPRG